MVSRKIIAAIVVLLLCFGTWSQAEIFHFRQGEEDPCRPGSGIYNGGHDLTIASIGTWPETNPHRLRMYYYNDEIYNSLIRFDKLNEIIPKGTIASASIKLTFQTDVVEWIPATIDIYPVLKPWHDPNCNWDFADYGVELAWEDDGAQDPNDRGLLDNNVDMGSRSWNPRVQYEGEYEFPLRAETVQKWIDNPGSNYGVIMVMNPDAATDVVFSSSEDSTVAFRPILTVTTLECPAIPADISHDCYVDLQDYAIMASQWMDTPGIPSADIAPAGGDNVVNLLDLQVLTNQWLQCSDPDNDDCYWGTGACVWDIPGDINRDCYVDFLDVDILAGQWLKPPSIPSADIAPAGGDNMVNLLDFAVLANYWLLCSDPENPICDVE